MFPMLTTEKQDHIRAMGAACSDDTTGIRWVQLSKSWSQYTWCHRGESLLKTELEKLDGDEWSLATYNKTARISQIDDYRFTPLYFQPA